MSQDRIASFPCFSCLSCSKQLLLVLVLEGIEAERSSIFQECSEGIDPRSSPCEIVWRLIRVHSWKILEGGMQYDAIMVTLLSVLPFSLLLTFGFPSFAKCLKTFMLSCRSPK
jgi:hypothetical protein